EGGIQRHGREFIRRGDIESGLPGGSGVIRPHRDGGAATQGGREKDRNAGGSRESAECHEQPRNVRGVGTVSPRRRRVSSRVFGTPRFRESAQCGWALAAHTALACSKGVPAFRKAERSAARRIQGWVSWWV